MEFNARYNKHPLNSREYKKRKHNWRKSKREIKKLNKKSLNAKFGQNYASDFDESEFEKMLGLDVGHPKQNIPGGRLLDDTIDSKGRRLVSAPLDWCTTGKMFSVKD